MKKLAYITTAILLLVTVANTSVQAHSKHEPTPPACPAPTPTPAPSNSSTHLPINSGVMFLMVAGVAIGVTTVNKAKAVKA